MYEVLTVSLMDAPPELVRAMAAYTPFRPCPNMFCYDGMEPDLENAELVEVEPGIVFAQIIPPRVCHMCHGSRHVFLICPN